MPIAQKLATALHRFNAKERNHLMRFALLGETNSGPPDPSVQWVHPNFFAALSTALATEVSGETQSTIALSKDARCVYAAMDYHLDWLRAALWCTSNEWPGTVETEFSPVARAAAIEAAPQQHDVMGNQEDIDLLVLIEDELMTYLVLVEAKGDTSFSRSQLGSKLARLKLILDGEHVPPTEQLRFALVLMAPEIQLRLGGSKTYAELAMHPTPATGSTMFALSNPPARLGNAIIRMPMANYPKTLNLVTRCDPGVTNPDGARHTHWKIAPR